MNTNDSKDSVNMREKLLIDSWEEIKRLRNGEDINIIDIASAAKYLTFCVSIYANLAEEKIQIDKQRAFDIEEIRGREDVKSDTRAERLYDTTKNGQRRIELTAKLSILTKLMTALKERINQIKFETKQYDNVT